MTDKGHCQLNPDDEEEYEEFYDFSKTYKDHPDVIKTSSESKKEGETDDPWEDVDFESGDEEVEDDEEIKEEEV